MLRHEREAWGDSHIRVAGVDEAGRGPLAGTVVAAAVVFQREFLEQEADRALAGLTDSKKLPSARREFFYALLLACPYVQAGIGTASVEEIDRLNILRATHLAMARAVERLLPLPSLALVDGLPVKGLPVPHRAIVGGDAASLSIAAASILAKVTRDREMAQLAVQFPAYGFDRHKGYGTRAHLEALRHHGPCCIHRKSFAPVARLSLGV
ncbi:MAG: ribonuclease HII [Verrucomicrobiota bacterium]|jgi:ribonuclease HII|nr:ribonuclease HII [Verrucomicrobiota bacterium]